MAVTKTAPATRKTVRVVIPKIVLEGSKTALVAATGHHKADGAHLHHANNKQNIE